MNTLKNLYINLNRNMKGVALGFIAAIMVAAALLPAGIIEDNLIAAWGLVALFSLLLTLGDCAWWDDVKEVF